MQRSEREQTNNVSYTGAELTMKMPPASLSNLQEKYQHRSLTTRNWRIGRLVLSIKSRRQNLLLTFELRSMNRRLLASRHIVKSTIPNACCMVNKINRCTIGISSSLHNTFHSQTVIVDISVCAITNFLKNGTYALYLRIYISVSLQTLQSSRTKSTELTLYTTIYCQ